MTTSLPGNCILGSSPGAYSRSRWREPSKTLGVAVRASGSNSHWEAERLYTGIIIYSLRNTLAS